jgi:3-oxoacyl-[acyl-carrier protein] reductase
MSVVAMVKAAAPPMVEAGWGRIVAITSIAVRQPIAHLILSNTARAGVTGFLKTAALELKDTGVTVNSLQPGLHRTGRVTQLYGTDADSMRMGEPADFGSIVAFVCSNQASFLTGAQINVDGGSYQALQ